MVKANGSSSSHDVSNSEPSECSTPRYCTDASVPAVASSPVPTIRSSTTSSVGGSPPDTSTDGFSPASPVTVGSGAAAPVPPAAVVVVAASSGEVVDGVASVDVVASAAAPLTVLVAVTARDERGEAQHGESGRDGDASQGDPPGAGQAGHRTCVAGQAGPGT